MLYQFQVTIASTGTPQALGTNAGVNHCTWINIQSRATNNAAGQNVGGPGPGPNSGAQSQALTGPGQTGAGPGFVLSPGQSFFLPDVGSPGPYDLKTVYVNGTTGDIFNILAFRR